MMAYRIKDWDKHFENNRTKELRRLDWVPIPIKQDGDGYTELLSHRHGAAHFGVWIALVEIAAKCSPRGSLLRSGGIEHTPSTLARISRMPSRVILTAIERLVSIGWLECYDPSEESYEESEIASKGVVSQIPHHDAGKSQDAATLARARRTEGNGMEREKSACAIVFPPPAEIPRKMNGHGPAWSEELYGRHPKKKDRALVEHALFTIMENAPDALGLYAEINRVHALWCSNFAWTENNGRFAPTLARWLEDRGWTQEPHEDKSKLERMMERI